MKYGFIQAHQDRFSFLAFLFATESHFCELLRTWSTASFSLQTRLWRRELRLSLGESRDPAARIRVNHDSRHSF